MQAYRARRVQALLAKEVGEAARKTQPLIPTSLVGKNYSITWGAPPFNLVFDRVAGVRNDLVDGSALSPVRSTRIRQIVAATTQQLRSY